MITYAVVDIETTGGYANQHGITEISILVHDGTQVIERFETLINPQQSIPPYIQALTGITDEMTATAPDFADVASQIYGLLEDKVFVAHNVNFDYSFVKHALQVCGYELSVKKLCTVRLSRKLFPGLASYSLGKLCNALSIPIYDRHRAGGDAMATAILLEMLIAKDADDTISGALKRGSKEHMLPPNLKSAELDKLPDSPGVYYFKDQKGKIIYVGKAKNLRKRVTTHFSGHNISRQRQDFLKNIYHIDFERCATELMAFILEAAEIKRWWPENNRAMKRFEQKFSLYRFNDQNGYSRLCIDKHRKNGDAIYSFNHFLDGHDVLKKLVAEHQLCGKLCFLQRGAGACAEHAAEHCLGACVSQEEVIAYNNRVDRAVDQLQTLLPSFIVVDRGRDEDERSYIWVEKGKFYGMGYLSVYADMNGPEEIRESLVQYPSNDYVIHLILDFRERFPYRVIELDGSTINVDRLTSTYTT